MKVEAHSKRIASHWGRKHALAAVALCCGSARSSRTHREGNRGADVHESEEEHHNGREDLRRAREGGSAPRSAHRSETENGTTGRKRAAP